jgi:hypothetical protein
VRPLSDLLSPDSAWPLVQQWQREAKNTVEILPVDRTRAEAVLPAVQVTTRSPMGAIIWESGGILVDHGWVRVLGAGCDRLDGDIARWNGLGDRALRPPTPGAFLVAHDAVGGVFAINGGALGPGNDVFYFAPDSLRWESLKRGYSDFVRFLFDGDLPRFYASFRWNGWERELAKLGGDQGLSMYPPPWTKEGKDPARVSRGVVPMTELMEMQVDVARQLGPR